MGRTSARKGVKLSEETKQKLRLANLGKKRSPEDTAKIVAKLKGRKSWIKGLKHKEETRIKMSLAHKARWAKKREELK